MSCPFIPPPHSGSSSDSQISYSRNPFTREKKHCDNKPPNRHFIGRTFRNSRGRKDCHDFRAKKTNSLVIFHLIIYTINYLYQTYAK